MSYDHYDEANKVVSELEQLRLYEQAKIIRESLENGATGTEIFMALRFNLDKIIKKGQMPIDLKNRCLKLRREINMQLENIR